MANICDFTMRIAGTEPAVAELLNRIVNEPGWRIYEVVQNGEFTPYPNCKSRAIGYVDAEGTCAWSVTTSMIANGLERTLKTEAKRLSLAVEVFSSEPGIGFQEHYLIDHDGKAVIADCVDFWEYSLDCITTDEEWKDIEATTGCTREVLMSTERDGFITAGGYGPVYGKFADLSKAFAEPVQTQSSPTKQSQDEPQVWYRVPVYRGNAYRRAGKSIQPTQCRKGRIYYTDDRHNRYIKEFETDKNGNEFLRLEEARCDDFRLYKSEKAAEDYFKWFDVYEKVITAINSNWLCKAPVETLEKVLQIICQEEPKGGERL